MARKTLGQINDQINRIYNNHGSVGEDRAISAYNRVYDRAAKRLSNMGINRTNLSGNINDKYQNTAVNTSKSIGFARLGLSNG